MPDRSECGVVNFGRSADRASHRRTARVTFGSQWRRGAAATAALLLFFSAGCLGPRPSPKPRSEPIRAIWVTRWDYTKPEDVAAIMRNCRNAGFNTVMFQARGCASTMYPSRLEPWAEELNGKDPGYDPLALACSEAHRNGLEIHAWVNVVPGWFGKKPPKNSNHIFYRKPEWFFHDAWGRRQPMGWYSSLNPCLPEVRAYLTDVMRDLVKRYPIDGLHMDYIRFPNDFHDGYLAMGGVPDYPRDARTLALFRRDTGKTPDAAPAEWNAWRTAQVNRLVAEIHAATQRIKPRLQLTAAVNATDKGLKEHFQDCRFWLARGWVDAVFPMNYAAQGAEFSQRLAAWQGRPGAVVMGVMADKREADLLAGQVRQSQSAVGQVCVFAYNSLFERRDEHGRPIMDGDSAARAQRRSAIARLFAAQRSTRLAGL